MTVALLHVSDIHFRTLGDRVLSRAEHIAHTINSYPDCTTCFVVATGDIAYSGTPSQYAIAEQFFRN